MKQATASMQPQGLTAPHGKLTSIFVAAKNDFTVEGMLRILADNTENKIVACVEPSEACWDKLQTTHPEILLLHHQAVMSPIREFFARIKDTAPGVNIIIFGQGMDDTFLLDVIRAGASGYINENMNSVDLLDAVREVRNGRLWVERRILEALAFAAIDMERTLENSIRDRINELYKFLTKRETAVFKLVLDGMATKEIAEKMHLSEQSIKLHLGRIFKKFQVPNRSQLILSTFSRICPVSNVYRLIRMTVDKRRIENGQPPLLKDPLEDDSSCSTTRR
jgi:DNA-binding NarL/FixJ family response regulator